MKNILLLICILISFQTIAQTSLSGKVTDEETDEPILFGTVSLFKDGSLVTGTDTDLDGNYNFPNIDPGTYDVEVSYVGYQTVRLTGVQVYGGQTNKADVMLVTGGESKVDFDSVRLIEYKVPLVKADQPSYGTLTPDQLKKLSIRNISPMAGLLKYVSAQPQSSISRSNFVTINNSTSPSLVKKLPSRRLNHTVQNMIDLKIIRIDYGN